MSDVAATWPRPELVAHESVLAWASTGTDEYGRVVRARTLGGWDLTVLPDRGLDIGEAWLGGLPVSWTAPVSDARSLPYPHDREWVTYFTGGLVATCGLRNFGPAGARGPMHGDFRFHPARDVAVRRQVDDAAATVEIRGVVDDGQIFGASLRLDRTITLSSDATGTASLEVHDRLTNLGPGPADARVLYHVNLGAPLVRPGTTVSVPAGSIQARDAHTDLGAWARIGEPVDTITEDVVEHVDPEVVDGFASATVSDGQRSVTLGWSADTLPHFYEWRMPTRRRWALGLEPATSRMTGPEPFDAVTLDTDETREHRLRITSRRSG